MTLQTFRLIRHYKNEKLHFPEGKNYLPMSDDNYIGDMCGSLKKKICSSVLHIVNPLDGKNNPSHNKNHYSSLEIPSHFQEKVKEIVLNRENEKIRVKTISKKNIPNNEHIVYTKNEILAHILNLKKALHTIYNTHGIKPIVLVIDECFTNIALKEVLKKYCDKNVLQNMFI